MIFPQTKLRESSYTNFNDFQVPHISGYFYILQFEIFIQNRQSSPKSLGILSWDRINQLMILILSSSVTRAKNLNLTHNFRPVRVNPPRNTLVQWTEQWQMILNSAKCVTLNCTRSLSPSVAAYNINNSPLNSVKQHKYFGVMMNNSMSWSGYIQEIINKASKTLNFVKQMLHQCTSSVKETAYITLVRPILEYASVVWSSNNIEMIQRRAARWLK